MKKQEDENKWVELRKADRIPHMQLCVISTNEGYKLARFARDRDCWIECGTNQPYIGGEQVMLIPNAPGDNTPIDGRDKRGQYSPSVEFDYEKKRVLINKQPIEMSDKTKAQLQAELKAAQKLADTYRDELGVKNKEVESLHNECEKWCEKINNLKSTNQQQALEIQDLHEGLKMLQDQLAVARAEKGEEEKAKLLAIECMHKSNETARIYGLEIESLKGEVEDWQTYYREKTVMDCVREWFTCKKEA